MPGLHRHVGHELRRVSGGPCVVVVLPPQTTLVCVCVCARARARARVCGEGGEGGGRGGWLLVERMEEVMPACVCVFVCVCVKPRIVPTRFRRRLVTRYSKDIPVHGADLSNFCRGVLRSSTGRCRCMRSRSCCVRMDGCGGCAWCLSPSTIRVQGRHQRGMEMPL
jgi:hypothetical protein